MVWSVLFHQVPGAEGEAGCGVLPRGCVGVTQSGCARSPGRFHRRVQRVGLAPDEDFHVYRDPPCLLLTAQRLRLLERERERNSIRWQYFDAAANTASAEPGFASALYYRVAKENSAARRRLIGHYRPP